MLCSTAGKFKSNLQPSTTAYSVVLLCDGGYRLLLAPDGGTSISVGYRSRRRHFLCSHAAIEEVSAFPRLAVAKRWSCFIVSITLSLRSLLTGSIASMYKSVECCDLDGATTLQITASAKASFAPVKSGAFSMVQHEMVPYCWVCEGWQPSRTLSVTSLNPLEICFPLER